MADVAAIRDRLKTRIETVSGLRGYDTAPSAPVPPCGIVWPAPGVFATDVTLDGAQDLEFVVTVLVSKISDDTAQDALDGYLSTAAELAAAIDSGSTADWDYAVTLQARAYGEYAYGGADGPRYLGFEIPVTVGVS